jgi:hypothetical protein
MFCLGLVIMQEILSKDIGNNKQRLDSMCGVANTYSSILIEQPYTVDILIISS